ncbi:MAG: hypothetical protein DDT19_02293 [Syntrophomonadaceae bacterium]|nr:hypothetical protein [Bacillota bacterium]
MEKIIIALLIVVLLAGGWLTNQLIDTQGVLASTQNELTATQTELASARIELLVAQGELDSLWTRFSDVRTRLWDMQAKYERVMSTGQVLIDPTYQEVLDFLARDKTNRNTYNETTYFCLHFAADVKTNATEEGLRVAFAYLLFPDLGHTIIAFNTVDRGLVFFEPQLDYRVNPEVGKSYWQTVPGEWETPGYDDTVVEIVLIW